MGLGNLYHKSTGELPNNSVSSVFAFSSTMRKIGEVRWTGKKKKKKVGGTGEL